MAYSDYGGYAFRNGVKVEERTDCKIPGDDENGSMYHAVLGDGPIFVGLYKQSHFVVKLRGKELAPDAIADTSDPEAFQDIDGKKYVNTDSFIDSAKPLILKVEGFTVILKWEHTDNYYQYAKLIQPDGSVWTGFSGYGVGSGFEDNGYDFSTDACVDALEAMDWGDGA